MIQRLSDVEVLVANARKAAREFLELDQSAVDLIVAAMACAGASSARKLAEFAV